MPYLLDSDYIIDYLNEIPGALTTYQELAPEGIWMSAVTYLEAYEGTFAAADPAVAQQKINDLTIAAPLLDFDRHVAVTCAELRVGLRARGRRVNQRAHDIQIAATALAYGLTIVTRNIDDYSDTGVEILPYA